jgi:hypothetical protein
MHGGILPITRNRFLAAVMVALTLSFTVATPAKADDPGRYEKFFSFESSSYSITDRYGTFDAQVSIFNPGHTMAWSFQMAPQIQLLVAGTMNCTADGWDGNWNPSGYHDDHPAIPAWYVWHSSIQNEPWNQDRILTGECRFRTNPPGQGTLSWRFNYEISDRGLGCTPNCPVAPEVPLRKKLDASAPPYSSTLQITYDH